MHQDHAEKGGCPACDAEASEEESSGKDIRILLIILSAVLFFTGLIHEFILEEYLLALVFFLATTWICGFSIAKEGISLLFQKQVSINLLMTIAAVGAFLIGHGEEGAAVVFLFYIAEFFEEHAAERSRRSIRALMKLAPEMAVVKKEKKEERVHVHNVDVDEIVLVRPGEKIPLDGVVKSGVSSVNEAPITGESIPVTKQGGDEVYAGTINNEGYLEIRVTKRSDETILSKIVKLVEEAQKKKSPTEKFIDRFSKYYTPTVILLAVAVATIPTIVLSLSFSEWFYKALVLLVVSCPCALAISTPVAMVSTITSAARNGILIKGSSYVEEIGKTRVFAFDKTGTLTEGRPEVTDIVSLSDSKREVLTRAASLEALSEHPIAKAIVERAEKEGLELDSVEDFESIPGKGVRGRIKGKVNYVGSVRLFREFSLDFPEDKAKRLENEGKSLVVVGNEREATGIIALMDKVRDATIKSIADLRKQGIRTEMITGDNERTAKTIARRIGVDDHHAELLPDDKVRIVGELKKKYGHAAMVGDGVNDAPALARASVGIAMGAIGSDVSLETADIALMKDDLSKLPYIIGLSKKTMDIVKQNVIASILIKGSFAILAFPELITLWLAVAIGDMGLSLAVILNAMRLSLIKAKG